MHSNKYKFLKPPTIEQIEVVVKKLGVPEAQFERYYNIHSGAIKRVRMGIRQMPAQHWHLFFEGTEATGSKPGSLTAHQPASIKTKQKKPSSDSRLSHLVNT